MYEVERNPENDPFENDLRFYGNYAAWSSTIVFLV
jgi:hypothetical protein